MLISVPSAASAMALVKALLNSSAVLVMIELSTALVVLIVVDTVLVIDRSKAPEVSLAPAICTKNSSEAFTEKLSETFPPPVSDFVLPT